MRYIVELPVYGLKGFKSFVFLTVWRPGQRGHTGEFFEVELDVDGSSFTWTRTTAYAANRLYRKLRGLVESSLANPLPGVHSP